MTQELRNEVSRINVGPKAFKHEMSPTGHSWEIDWLQFDEYTYTDVSVFEFEDGTMVATGELPGGRKAYGAAYRKAIAALKIWVKNPCHKLYFAQEVHARAYDAYSKRVSSYENCSNNSRGAVTNYVGKGIAQSNMLRAERRLKRIKRIVRKLKNRKEMS